MRFRAVCVILALAGVLLFAQTEPVDIDGFRGFKWDTPYAKMSEGLQKSSSFNPGFKGYEKPGDDMLFAGVRAHSIIYLFKKDLFNCISIGYYNNQMDSVLANLSGKYGPPRATENDFLRNYEWYLPSSVMVLSWFVANESDKSVALGIRKPK